MQFWFSFPYYRRPSIDRKDRKRDDGENHQQHHHSHSSSHRDRNNRYDSNHNGHNGWRCDEVSSILGFRMIFLHRLDRHFGEQIIENLGLGRMEKFSEVSKNPYEIFEIQLL
mmetsp:Transcript_44642/g.87532  ORF Transcript_44642/g.87532 Transcript_44642/m.87532 type:complete len:112 (-) Transcript_44642:782-1117(-)